MGAWWPLLGAFRIPPVLLVVLIGETPTFLDSSHVKDFMTYLAVEKNVAESTQNQAFNAILFLYRHVLDKPIDDISDAIRADRPKRLPVVLTKEEVKQLFSYMSGTALLMAELIYGSGLRLHECLELRVKILILGEVSSSFVWQKERRIARRYFRRNWTRFSRNTWKKSEKSMRRTERMTCLASSFLTLWEENRLMRERSGFGFGCFQRTRSQRIR